MMRLIGGWLGMGVQKVWVGAGVLTALAAMYWRAWSGGAKRERERQESRRAVEMAESMGRRVDTLNKAKEVRDETESLDSSDLDDRLRRWTRNDDT